MNGAQNLWWMQASADFLLFEQLRANGAAECHLLHYLQMATEKLSKAYFWRSGHPPPKSHTGFVRFLKALLDRPADLDRIARALGFPRDTDVHQWVRKVQPVAYALQNMAPTESQDGPNPEYPWPHNAPAHTPIGYTFDLWRQLKDSGNGRKLIMVTKYSIANFGMYA